MPSDCEDLFRQGQERLNQIMPSGGEIRICDTVLPPPDDDGDVDASTWSGCGAPDVS